MAWGSSNSVPQDRFVKRFEGADFCQVPINNFLAQNPQLRIVSMAYETQGIVHGVLVYFERIDLGK